MEIEKLRDLVSYGEELAKHKKVHEDIDFVNVGKIEGVLRLPVEKRAKAVENNITNWQKEIVRAEIFEAKQKALDQQIKRLNRPIEEFKRGELLTLLKEELIAEAKDLQTKGNRLSREEVFQERMWPQHTLIFAASLQSQKAFGAEMLNSLTDGIQKMKSVPEAIAYVEHMKKSEGRHRPISSFGSQDSWQEQEEKKRFVLLIRGRGEHAETKEKEEAIFLGGLTRISTSLDKYGRYVIAGKNDAEYQDALKGKYKQDGAALVIRSIPSKQPVEPETITTQEEKDMDSVEEEIKTFKANNPGAEFMIVYSGHGIAREPLLLGENKPIDPDYLKKEGSYIGNLGIDHRVDWNEGFLKKFVIDSIGESPCIFIIDGCESGAFITGLKKKNDGPT